MYDIYEHRHSLAVWGAGRAYSRQGPGHTIAMAKHLIEKSGLGAINTADHLPPSEKMSDFIHERIQAVIDVSQGVYYTKRTKGEPDAREALVCTYGRAQKLVNMYLKIKIVCAGYHDHPHVKNLHPPLDAVLLEAFNSSIEIDHKSDLKVFRSKLAIAKALGKAWTKFDRSTYDAYIAAIRIFQGGQPLWAVERLWSPEREALPA
ncbi:hypothetical protein ALP05_102096 [Pseudomonas caricapapayae]|uniref:Uncharacterized protein n=1 Tax=Pseudomonas caricapapayae TaxID=46678 RepID=A0A3M6EV34_9PSED|nr:hypothetical protein [Pseudomonas caricapapayae]RMV72211.1 hypothetical protein ALP05_102096 [Pseudomonas caricapapayae]